MNPNQQIREHEQAVWVGNPFTQYKLQQLRSHKQTLLEDASKQSTINELGQAVALRLLVEANTITQVIKILENNTIS
jgi:hypothetical protein